ncbi:MAG: hypothetical protein KDH94_08625, partial [Coxiellaceae bacterium]|nr:hypothetical protein [Coxiellaceae bacterium]
MSANKITLFFKRLRLLLPVVVAITTVNARADNLPEVIRHTLFTNPQFQAIMANREASKYA